MTMLYLVAFLTLAALFIIRTPSAIRSPHARFSWLACGVGALAILTLGPIVPVATIDAALGGTNIIYLVQCWLASLAFWLMVQAARVAGGTSDHRTPHLLLIGLYWAATAAPFLVVQDRTPTDPLFIHNRADQLAAVLCATIYMLGIAVMSVRLVIHVAGRKSGGYWFFRAGVLLILTAIAVEITGLFSELSGAPSQLVTALWSVFDPLFYPGVVLIVAGQAWFWVARHLRSRRATQRIRRLQLILEQRGLSTPPIDDDKAFTVYALLVRIKDSAGIDRLHLSAEESRVVDEAESWLERILPQMIEIAA